jgi:pimeloyl-ACP methyl ester carboxylesterase
MARSTNGLDQRAGVADDSVVDGSIRPFRVAVPATELEDLHDRIRRTRWPRGWTEASWTRGVPVDHLRRLADYWLQSYDWRRAEAGLNEIPQYLITVDDQPIHFWYVRSPELDAMPLVLTHGWPSSGLEFTRLIGPLTDPRAHGGDPANAFHVVIPTLPGYGLSNPLAGPGWGNLFRVAQAWDELMRGLGFHRYAVHGTDAGSGVASLLAMLAGDRVIGIHLTGTSAAMPFGPPLAVDQLSGQDRLRAERFNAQQEEGLGYLHLQATRPQTLGYALDDSPVGLLAWVVEKFQEWTDPANELPEEAVDLDQLLTSVSITWFGGAGAASAQAVYEGMRIYREMASSWDASSEHDQPAGPPTAYAVFAADTSIRSLAERAGRVDRWSTFDVGGHFPAMEVPELVVNDLREFFGGLRTGSQ